MATASPVAAVIKPRPTPFAPPPTGKPEGKVY
jgi:hypothetical protein